MISSNAPGFGSHEYTTPVRQFLAPAWNQLFRYRVIDAPNA